MRGTTPVSLPHVERASERLHAAYADGGGCLDGLAVPGCPAFAQARAAYLGARAATPASAPGPTVSPPPAAPR